MFRFSFKMGSCLEDDSLCVSFLHNSLIFLLALKRHEVIFFIFIKLSIKSNKIENVFSVSLIVYFENVVCISFEGIKKGLWNTR